MAHTLLRHAPPPPELRGLRGAAARRGCMACALALWTCLAAGQPAIDWTRPLADAPGDAARGRAVVANRQLGLCLLCHPAPIAEERFQGNLAPDLAGAGARWSAAQLRERVADARQLNPQSIMPAYLRTDGLHRVGAAWQGKPLLTPQQVDDVVAYLLTLR